MVKSIAETVVDTLGEVDPQKYMQEQLGQAQTAAGGVEGAKEKYGVKGYKKGGKVKQILKKIEETSNRVPRQGPKTDIKKMPKNFSEFGVDVDPTDKKPFVYGVKKTGKDTFIHGASKGKKDYVGSIEKGSFKGSYERSLKGDDVVKGTYSKNGFRAGVSKSGGNKQFTLGFEKKFKQGGMVCRGQGKARKKNFKVY